MNHGFLNVWGGGGGATTQSVESLTPGQGIVGTIHSLDAGSQLVSIIWPARTEVMVSLLCSCVTAYIFVSGQSRDTSMR